MRDELPPKFTAAEREAYRWLRDCGVRPWLVDLVTREVWTPERTYPGLVEYRQRIEKQVPSQPLKEKSP